MNNNSFEKALQEIIFGYNKWFDIMYADKIVGKIIVNN
jgi:hypothetical protein